MGAEVIDPGGVAFGLDMVAVVLGIFGLQVAVLVGQGLPQVEEGAAFFERDGGKLIGAPTGFTMEVREVRLASGAGFVVVICGNIMTMPGLPKKPAAVSIDVDADGKITGLF